MNVQHWLIPAKTTTLPQPINLSLSSNITATNYSEHLAMLNKKSNKWSNAGCNQLRGCHLNQSTHLCHSTLLPQTIASTSPCSQKTLNRWNNAGCYRPRWRPCPTPMSTIPQNPSPSPIFHPMLPPNPLPLMPLTSQCLYCQFQQLLQAWDKAANDTQIAHAHAQFSAQKYPIHALHPPYPGGSQPIYHLYQPSHL